MGLFGKLFGNKQWTQTAPAIDIGRDGLRINTKNYTFPIPVATLKAIWGESELFELVHSNVFTWQNTGIYAYSNDGASIQTLSIELNKTEDFRFLPQKQFTGTLTIHGSPYQNAALTRKNADDDFVAMQTGVHKLFFSLSDTGEIMSIQVSAHKTAIPETDYDKYILRKTPGEKIVFTDFNFKLAVIEELMYQQELIEPRFDIFEFVKLYRKRTIDIDNEGYAPIPEAVAYFRELEIDKNLAGRVTEIYQDGGNDIYMNLIPFWDGEDDIFEISSYEDLMQFKNLKKMTLFNNDPAIINELRSKGIDAQTL